MIPNQPSASLLTRRRAGQWIAGAFLAGSCGIHDRITADDDGKKNVDGGSRQRESGHLEQGSIDTPIDAETVAEPYRLKPDTFTYRLVQSNQTNEKLEIFDLQFPSPVVTDVAVNNTVHCEYYCPIHADPVPHTIVLHILGGDFALSRLFCHGLATQGIASLFLKMPYYGPRRDPNSPKRMIALDPHETVAGMTQAVLDIRRAAVWLQTRPELDRQQGGIFGISLGAITAALAASQETLFGKVCLLLGGGDLGTVTWESRELSAVRERWLAQGGTRESLISLLRPVDPAVHAHRLRDRKVLMLNALEDEVIPRACTDALWEAAGKPPIVWYPGTHYTVARHVLDAMHRVGSFMKGG